jgi:hypothetical protein
MKHGPTQPSQSTRTQCRCAKIRDFLIKKDQYQITNDVQLIDFDAGNTEGDQQGKELRQRENTPAAGGRRPRRTTILPPTENAAARSPLGIGLFATPARTKRQWESMDRIVSVLCFPNYLQQKNILNR